MRGVVADFWHRANEEQRVKYLLAQTSRGQSVHTELLDEDREVLDALGEQRAQAKIWCTTVDVAGLRDSAPGLCALQSVGNYRKRGK